MKNLQKLSFLLLLTLSGVLVFTACEDDDDDMQMEESTYEVNVAIAAPAEGATVQAGEAFNVRVEYSRQDDIIHNVQIDILDTRDTVVQTLISEHIHTENTYIFEKSDVVINDTGTYKLRAMTTDMHSGGHGEDMHGGGHNHDDSHNAKNMKVHTFTVE